MSLNPRWLIHTSNRLIPEYKTNPTLESVKQSWFRKTQIRHTMDTSREYHIELFTGRNNYSVWKWRMKDVLISKGLKKALTCKKPERMVRERLGRIGGEGTKCNSPYTPQGRFVQHHGNRICFRIVSEVRKHLNGKIFDKQIVFKETIVLFENGGKITVVGAPQWIQ